MTPTAEALQEFIDADKAFQQKEVEMDRLLEGSLNWTGSSSMEKLSMLIMPFFMIPAFSRAWWRDSAALRMLGSQCISASSKYSENYA